jgi:hypothetical protein
MEEQDGIELRNHATLGLYACVPEDEVEELAGWLEERGIQNRSGAEASDIPCAPDERVLLFGTQNPNWVCDAMRLIYSDVKLGEGVVGPETEYPPPLDTLLRLGDPRTHTPDYATMGFTQEHVPGLIHIAVDDELHDADPDDPRVWAPVHAWRVLGLLRAPEAVKPLIELLWRIWECEDEWVGEEVPDVLANIGEPAILPLLAYFDRELVDEQANTAIVDAIGLIGMRYPECRNDCVRVLTERLTRFDRYKSGINAFLINSLVNLKAVESMAVIEAAFAFGKVDLTVLGDVEDVRIELGLQAARTTPPPRTWLNNVRDARAPEIGGGAGGDEWEDRTAPYTAPEKPGRNDPCPCGSGKKYKKCCGKG